MTHKITGYCCCNESIRTVYKQSTHNNKDCDKKMEKAIYIINFVDSKKKENKRIFKIVS